MRGIEPLPRIHPLRGYLVDRRRLLTQSRHQVAESIGVSVERLKSWERPDRRDVPPIPFPIVQPLAGALETLPEVLLVLGGALPFASLASRLEDVDCTTLAYLLSSRDVDRIGEG